MQYVKIGNNKKKETVRSFQISLESHCELLGAEN